MKHILLILSLLIITACSNKGLIETNQKKIYLSNTKVYYDMDVKSFKIDFSINNYTKETINNLLLGFNKRIDSFNFLENNISQDQVNIENPGLLEEKLTTAEV